MAALAERPSVTTWAASLLRSPTNADAPITITRKLVWTVASAWEMMTGRKGICEKAQAQGRQLVRGGHVVAETDIDVVIPGRFLRFGQ
jgi:hypothetical protein